jgi:RNA polymerase sigma-70 factor (ECF subfamily)
LAHHAPAFLLYARQQARCEADACDLVQDAVVESWQRQQDGSPPPPPVVYTLIRQRAVDLARRNGSRSEREAAVVREGPRLWFDCAVEERERSRMIENAMNQLPGLYREVLTLKIWGGLTFAEIGTTLDIPANTASSRYRYGLIELRKLTRELLA